MTSFQKELIEGIQEVSMSTGLSTKECIRQAIELTKREKEEHDTDTESLENEVDRYYKRIFRGWRN